MAKQIMQKKNDKTAIVIMAGGEGTRFWPLSTEDRPKQFLEILGEGSLLQRTFERAMSVADHENIYVVANDKFTQLIVNQIPKLYPSNLIKEPYKRNTAAAIALADRMIAKQMGEDFVMVVLPSDHSIGDMENFTECINKAVESASVPDDEALYTFGIKPRYPSTCYGYLECSKFDGEEWLSVNQFVEKPQQNIAQKYVEKGYLWNSGMFVWHHKNIADAIEALLPEHQSLLNRAFADYGAKVFNESLKAAYFLLPPISIDYGVLEKAKNVRAFASTFDWDDMGSWISLEKYLGSYFDEAGYESRSNVPVLLGGDNAHSNVVYSDDPKLEIMIVDQCHLLVLIANGHLIIAPIDSANKLKSVYEDLLNRQEEAEE